MLSPIFIKLIIIYFSSRDAVYSVVSRLVEKAEKYSKTTKARAADQKWIESKIEEDNFLRVRDISKSNPPSPTENLLSPKRPAEEPAPGETGRGKRIKIENSKYSSSTFETAQHQKVFSPTALDFDALGLEDNIQCEEYIPIWKAKPKRQKWRCSMKFENSIDIADRYNIPDWPLALLLCAHNKDLGITDPICYPTGDYVTELRSESGEKELTSHFNEKVGFDNMEFDSKKSKTLMEDGEIKVISNVTCISNGSFLEFYQLPVYIDEEGNEKEDGTGETHGKELHKVVKKFKAEEKLTYIGADSTRVNTGHKTGIVL